MHGDSSLAPRKKESIGLSDLLILEEHDKLQKMIISGFL
ncbi:hypothetical protein QG37_06524 [Candidozyma auris]|uniref:Uncharacterized protein n=1 Tax=Candidozyma auris TaxID=498019 RepID=A0A0L0NSU2_CANAR|nr:hypothetical protein QG37_06524 [[Candida] auris]